MTVITLEPNKSELAKTSEQYDAALDEFAAVFEPELKVVLNSIVEAYFDKNIYAIVLYHGGDICDYLIPSILCEKGLEEVARDYAESGDMSEEEYKQDLRWIPADSPYHDNSDLYKFSETESHLLQLRELIDQIYSLEDSMEGVGPLDSPVSEFFQSRNKLMARINTIGKIAIASEELQSYRDNGGILYLTCGDPSGSDEANSIQSINGQAAFERYLESSFGPIARSDETEYSFFVKTLELEDFDDVISAFIPKFEVIDDMVCLKSDGPRSPGDTIAFQSNENTLSIFELMMESPFYCAMSIVFRDCSQATIKADSIYRKLVDALCRQLAKVLEGEFPSRSFVIHSTVVSCTHIIQFYEPIHQISAARDPEAIISDVYLVGSKPEDVRIPVALVNHSSDMFKYFVVADQLDFGNYQGLNIIPSELMVFGSNESHEAALEELKLLLIDFLAYADVKCASRQLLPEEVIEWKQFLVSSDEVANKTVYLDSELPKPNKLVLVVNNKELEAR